MTIIRCSKKRVILRPPSWATLVDYVVPISISRLILWSPGQNTQEKISTTMPPIIVLLFTGGTSLMPGPALKSIVDLVLLCIVYLPAEDDGL